MLEPRPLVDLAAAVSSALLLNESQWMGIIVKPINYSLKGAILHIDPGPGLVIEETHIVEMERYDNALENASAEHLKSTRSEDSTGDVHSQKLALQNSKLELPEWASNITSVLWIPVRAISDELVRGTSEGDCSDKLLVIVYIYLSRSYFNFVFYFLLITVSIIHPSGVDNLQTRNLVDGLRTIALKLDFGVSHNQTFERHCFMTFSFILIPVHIC